MPTGDAPDRIPGGHPCTTRDADAPGAATALVHGSGITLRILHAVSLLALCWYGMMLVHESGHMIATVLLGGRIEQVVLHPFAISQTVRSGSQSALADTWAGPLVGVLVPLALWWAACRRCARAVSDCRLFAGFCLLANGVYLGAGWIDGIGDAGDILAEGGALWTLLLFGTVSVGAGLALIDGTHHELGFGRGARPVSTRRALLVIAVLLMVTGIGLVGGLRT